MDDIRLLIKRKSPSSIAFQIIRTALTLHPVAARLLVNEFCQPLKDQRRFIRKFDNEHWKGSLIMSEMVQCDDDTAISRLKNSNIVIFEVHGGGFRVGNSTMYMDSFINWLTLFESKHNLNVCIMSIEYGLAPQCKYPEPIHECINAYKYLTQDLDVSPRKVIFSGDSAGGALIVETLLRTYSPGILNNMDVPRTNFDLPLPAGLLLSSPLLSSEITHDSWNKYEKDDIVSFKLVEKVFKEFLGLPKTKMEDLPILRLSQISSGFDRFLPNHILMFVGSKEVLRDGIIKMAEALKKEKMDVTLIEEDFIHDWFLIHHVIDNKKRNIIQKYDEMFVDFAVKAVQNVSSGISNEDVDVVQELIVSDVIQASDKLQLPDFSRPLSDELNTVVL